MGTPEVFGLGGFDDVGQVGTCVFVGGQVAERAKGEEAFTELLGLFGKGVYDFGNGTDDPELGFVDGYAGDAGGFGAGPVKGVAEVGVDFVAGLTGHGVEGGHILDDQVASVETEDEGGVGAILVPVAGDKGVVGNGGQGDRVPVREDGTERLGLVAGRRAYHLEPGGFGGLRNDVA
jgi:hypothetical protein